MIHQVRGLKSTAGYAQLKGFITPVEYAELIAILDDVQSIMNKIRNAQLEG